MAMRPDEKQPGVPWETALPLMRDGRHCNFMFMPDGEDPDTYIRKHGKGHFESENSYTSLSNYMFDQLKIGLNTNTPEGIAAYLKEVKNYLKLLTESSLKDFINSASF